jgi:starch-binding outer membrane protein SusE/F
MKNIFKSFLALLSVAVFIAACKKDPPLLNFKPSNGLTLELTTRAEVLPSPNDGERFSVRFRWSNPNMATSLSNVRFNTEIDINSGNWEDPIRSTTFGTFSDSFQSKTINDYLLAKGYGFGETVTMKARTVAAYSNNNDMVSSNIVNFTFRTYKVPPKVALPGSGRLFLVGSATEGSWSNPVPVPRQEFARLDETTWAGVFNLFGGGQYLVLPVNGQWQKYSLADNSKPGIEEGGEFGQELPDNFKGPLADGLYKITLDFQRGQFKVEPFTQQHGLPTQLVVVGGASPWGWNNSADNPQRFTQLNSAEWQINSINLKADDGYLILPTPGDWGRKYGVPNRDLESARISGTFVPEGQDFKSPREAGNYRIRMNFVTETYQLTKL